MRCQYRHHKYHAQQYTQQHSSRSQRTSTVPATSVSAVTLSTAKCGLQPNRSRVSTDPQMFQWPAPNGFKWPNAHARYPNAAFSSSTGITSSHVVFWYVYQQVWIFVLQESCVKKCYGCGVIFAEKHRRPPCNLVVKHLDRRVSGKTTALQDSCCIVMTFLIHTTIL